MHNAQRRDDGWKETLLVSSQIDVLIRGGRVVDGTGNPWFYGDVALSGDRVLEVAPRNHIETGRAREVVDASGAIVCPGFIDIQSHSIVPLMVDGRCLSKVRQGVTTEIMGEAWTPAPFGGRIEDPLGDQPAWRHRLGDWPEHARSWRCFGDWLRAMVDRGVSPNVGSFLGGGTLREYVKGMDMGEPSAEELAEMRRVMEDSMRDGAFGVSYALIYPPDAYASTAEITEVCRVVAECGGVYITHIRSEAEELLEAIGEAVEIGRGAGVPVEIYHLKASGERNWHLMPRAIGAIERAREEGVDVTADMYPYTASGTGLSAILPPWTAEGGKLYERLRDPEVRARARRDILHPRGGWEAMASPADAPLTMPVGFRKPENQRFVGRRLSEIADELGKDWVETVFDLLVSEEQSIPTIYFKMSEDNLRLQLVQPWIKIASDAGGLDPEWAVEAGPVHPRAYGTFTRVLSRYVREERLLALEDAVRKMTSAVADRLGMRDRGILRSGCYADVVVFDPDTVSDLATFERPHQLSVGVRDVWVNGRRVLSAGEHTGALPGRFVTGPGVP